MIWHPFTAQQGAAPQLRIASAGGDFVYDDSGKEYVDAIASWWTMIHGHRHEKIIAAIQRQLQSLDHVMLAGFTHAPAEELAARLLQLTNGNFSRVIYSDNGSTAVEVMLKLAVQYWANYGEPQRRLFINFDCAYHGDTFGAMSVGADSVFNRPFRHLLFNARTFRYPASGAEAELILTELELFLQEHASEIAGMVIEPLIAAAGGMVVQSEGILSRLTELAREYGVLMLFDEVFSGLGRTGAMFAYEKAGVVPDMVALAKGLTGGALPLAVTLVTKKIHAAFVSDLPAKTFYHGHTMTGNPPGCAAALASLDLFQSENRLQQVRLLEDRMRLYWLKLAQRHAGKITDMRFLGAMSAATLVTAGDDTGYTAAGGRKIREHALAAGVIVRPLGDVIYVTPPYNISEASLVRVFSALDSALTQYEIHG